MENYIDIAINSFNGYANYLVQQVSTLSVNSYFYWLIVISILVWGLEILLPWRKKQAIIRKDFWLDGFYMFFNFFLFGLIGYAALSRVGVELFSDFLALFGIKNMVAIEVQSFPIVIRMLLLFVLADFIQWNTHRLLHRTPWLWEFHKLHHSVKEMGFSAHLRFHWMETIVYKTIQYIPLGMIGFGIDEYVIIVYLFSIVVGHINHANLNWDYGPLKYIFNNPKMHIWHHSKKWPKERPYAGNYGITLSIWDYIFGTAYVPKDGKDIELGFDSDEEYPTSFFQQIIYPFSKKKNVKK